MSCSCNEVIMENVDNSINTWREHENLCALTSHDLYYLPTIFIMKRPRQIIQVWEKLPLRFTSTHSKEHFELCLDHYNRGPVEIDGPLQLNYNVDNVAIFNRNRLIRIN